MEASEKNHMSMDIFSSQTVSPFKILGLTGEFWNVNIDILIATWIGMGIMLTLGLICKYYLTRKSNLVATAFEQVISIFSDLCKESLPSFNYNYFAFVTALFFFTFFGCLVGILPFVKEATNDLNTAIAVGITSFLYVQYQKIRVHGIGGYLKEFAEPFFALIPIHIVGELSKIASMSFRLFGNILGGAIIFEMVRDNVLGGHKIIFFSFMALALFFALVMSFSSAATKFPRLHKLSVILISILFLISWLQIGLGILEGIIQSIVVTMLTITYLAIGTYEEPSHEHKEAT
jgi:F-type H+-transporting ATPase subunit a